MAYTSLRQADVYISRRYAFTGNNLQGRVVPPGRSISMGLLNERDRAALQSLLASSWTYVVWSYSTPIAWCVADDWHIVTQKFSRTTSRHQGVVRRAVSPALAFTA